MLKIARSISQLNFSSLMNVYAESNLSDGKLRYPTLPLLEQILAAEQDFYRYLNDVFFLQSDSFYAIWEDREGYMSSLRIEPYYDGYLLSALETAQEARGNGYAKQLIRAVLEYLSQQGKGILYSHVAKGNYASLAVHRSCGFELKKDYAIYLDGSVLTNSCTLMAHFGKYTRNR